MERRERISSQRLIAAVTRACSTSSSAMHVHEYFRDQGAWERVLRRSFVDLRLKFDAGEDITAEELAPRVANVNRLYPTRCKRTLFQPLSACILDRLAQEPWWRSRERPRLLGDAQTANALGRVVPDVLGALVATVPGAKRPLSLTSKCLHFLFPDAFAIFDSQAANSIQMWTYFALPDGTPDAKRFGRWSVAEPNGRGYSHLLAFYERLWSALTDEGRAALQGAVRALDESFADAPSERGEFVGILDVIDKHLWQGDGNPIVLGLAEPPD